MKKIALLSAGIIALAGCVATPADEGTEGFTRISDAATFQAEIVGRALSGPDAPAGQFFRLNPDGSLSGDIGQGSLAGVWSFRDGYWCRTWSAGLRPDRLNVEDCQLVELGNGQVALTRDRGAGNQGIFDID